MNSNKPLSVSGRSQKSARTNFSKFSSRTTRTYNVNLPGVSRLQGLNNPDSKQSTKVGSKFAHFFKKGSERNRGSFNSMISTGQQRARGNSDRQHLSNMKGAVFKKHQTGSFKELRPKTIKTGSIKQKKGFNPTPNIN